MTNVQRVIPMVWIRRRSFPNQSILTLPREVGTKDDKGQSCVLVGEGTPKDASGELFAPQE